MTETTETTKRTYKKKKIKKKVAAKKKAVKSFTEAKKANISKKIKVFKTVASVIDEHLIYYLDNSGMTPSEAFFLGVATSNLKMKIENNEAPPPFPVE